MKNQNKQRKPPPEPVRHPTIARWLEGPAHWSSRDFLNFSSLLKEQKPILKKKQKQNPQSAAACTPPAPSPSLCGRSLGDGLSRGLVPSWCEARTCLPLNLVPSCSRLIFFFRKTGPKPTTATSLSSSGPSHLSCLLFVFLLIKLWKNS